MGDDAAELARLLDARNEHPESLAEIDAEIWQRFGRTRAVLVLDMCGFSRLTMRYGITHFLAMIRRLQTIVRPVIAAGDGHVVKRGFELASESTRRRARGGVRRRRPGHPRRAP